MKPENKAADLINFLSSNKKTFEIESTNSFIRVKYSGERFDFFFKKRVNLKVLNLARKLREEISKSGFQIEEKNITEYFAFNTHLNNKVIDPGTRFYCVDIKQAYLQVLLNFGLISKPLFDEILALPKSDRLMVIGMLARRKNIYQYINGKIEGTQTEVSPYEQYFYFCVEKIYTSMQMISHELKDNFLFFWVDCVFFTGTINIERVFSMLDEMGFTYEKNNLHLLGIHESKSFACFDFINEQKGEKNYKVPKVKPDTYMVKARQAFVNLDSKNFLHYFSEYKKMEYEN